MLSLSSRTSNWTWPRPHPPTWWEDVLSPQRRAPILTALASWKRVRWDADKPFDCCRFSDFVFFPSFILCVNSNLSLSLCVVASYRVGLDVSIALEFRTSRTSGVLLAISNQANDGLGIEIVRGKVDYSDWRNGSTSWETHLFTGGELDEELIPTFMSAC